MTQRHVPFDKAINFRDLGGYETADGRRVKWNRLFRCGHMALLTDADLARLHAMDISVICDFRAAEENEKNPSRLSPELAALRHNLQIVPKAAMPFADYVKSFGTGELDADSFRAVQHAIYREYVTDFAGHYATMFRLIMAGEGRAALIHCTAGKDRTGIGAALILFALGVPEETIHEDYLLSNGCPHLHKFIQYLVDEGVGGSDSTESNEARHARLMPLFGVQADRIQIACDTMRETAGSVDNYLRTALDITDDKRALLRKWFVE
jgi:protein-tyrosine phosphatase